MVLKAVGKGVYEYSPDYDFDFKPYTVNVKGDYSTKAPHPQVMQDVISYYQRYFSYNDKDLDTESESFVSFIGDIVSIIKQKGTVNITITSSASKVPTKTWKNNTALSKERAMITKKLIDQALAEKNISGNQYRFVDINTLITGPEYKRDHIKNKSTYEQHQYVRIFIK